MPSGPRRTRCSPTRGAKGKTSSRALNRRRRALARARRPRPRSGVGSWKRNWTRYASRRKRGCASCRRIRSTSRRSAESCSRDIVCVAARSSRSPTPPEPASQTPARAPRKRLAKAKNELGVLGHLVRGPRRVPGELGLDLFDLGHRPHDLFDVLLDQRAGRAAHRGQAVEHLHLRDAHLGVVEQAELDDVHPELRVLDGAERLDHVVARHAAQPSDQYTNRRTFSRRSRAKKWIPSTKRTQLQRVHITSECVRALSARKRTPRSRSPFETPVVATILSPETRSSVVNTCSMSSIPYSRAASISRREVGQSCVCTSPPRQRSAPAVSTASRVPPIPIARWSFVPRIAAEIDAVTVPSWMSLIRAPEAGTASVNSWGRGRP